MARSWSPALDGSVEGEQFHPKALLTEHGKVLLANF